MTTIACTPQTSAQGECRIDPTVYANARELAARERSIAVAAAFAAAFASFGALARRVRGSFGRQATGVHGGQLRGV